MLKNIITLYTPLEEDQKFLLNFKQAKEYINNKTLSINLIKALNALNEELDKLTEGKKWISTIIPNVLAHKKFLLCIIIFDKLSNNEEIKKLIKKIMIIENEGNQLEFIQKVVNQLLPNIAAELNNPAPKISPILQKFIDAQTNGADGMPNLEAFIEELKGDKIKILPGYIFPRINIIEHDSGLGITTNKFDENYLLEDVSIAEEYINNETLFNNLKKAIDALFAEKNNKPKYKWISEILNKEDFKKFILCVTMFVKICKNENNKKYLEEINNYIRNGTYSLYYIKVDNYLSKKIDNYLSNKISP